MAIQKKVVFFDKEFSKKPTSMNGNALSICFLLAFCFSGIAFAQQYRLKGVVKDESNKPIEFTAVTLMKNDSVKAVSTITDNKGEFDVKAEKGIYILSLKQLGQSLLKKEIRLFQDTDLGFLLINQSVALKGVTINAKKPLIERKIDRLVFNVENSIAATGGDALDALRVTPGIRVQDDKISMIGKSGMAVMIDDRLTQLSGNDLLNFLKTIKADDIKSIEVITNPPAKYDAEGNSGIVNLKLKKAKPNSWSSSVSSRYRQAAYAMGSASANFTYQKNKFSLFANVSYDGGAYGPVETNKINYPEQLWTYEEKRKEHQKSIGDKIGIDYDFSKKLTLGVQYAGSYGKPIFKSNNLANIINNTNRQTDLQIKTASSTQIKTNLNSLNCHAIYKIDSLDKKISLDFDYFNYQSNKNALLSSNNYYGNGERVANSYFSLNDVGNQNISNHSLNLDMEMPAKPISLNYGGKLSFSNTRNDINNYNLSAGSPVFNPLQSNQFNYKENVQALYFSANKKIGQNWESKIGLRMENTQITGNSPALSQSNKYRYTGFFPTAYIAYNLNENNSLSVNYGRRISRPPFFFLNPFKWHLNRYGYAEGNPYLRPSYTNNIEFNYTYKENWSNSIYVSFTENGYGQISILLDYPNQKIYAANYYKGTTIGLSESYTYNKLKRWSSVNSFDLSYRYAKSKIPFLLQQKEGFNAFFSTSNDFILNGAQTLLFNISYWYSFPGISDLDRTASSSQFDASLKMLLLHKNLQITIAGKDIFRSNESRFTSYSNGIEVSFKNYYDYRSLSVSLLYKFGNNSLKSNQRNFGNEEEKNRVN